MDEGQGPREAATKLRLSGVKVINLKEIVAQSFEDGLVGNRAAMGAVSVMLGEDDHAAPRTKALIARPVEHWTQEEQELSSGLRFEERAPCVQFHFEHRSAKERFDRVRRTAMFSTSACYI